MLPLGLFEETRGSSSATKRKRASASDPSINSHEMARPPRARRRAAINPSSSSDSIFSTPRQRGIRDREESLELLGRKLPEVKVPGITEVGHRSVVPKNRCLSAPPAREKDAYDRSCWPDMDRIKQDLMKSGGKAKRHENAADKWDPKWQFESMTNYWASLERLASKNACNSRNRSDENQYGRSLKEDCWKLYIKNIAPLELATPNFSRLFDDMLLKSDFESKPLIMVVGQHEHLGKDYFVARLSDADHFPVDVPFWDTKFVFVAHSDASKGLIRSMKIPGKKGSRFYTEPGEIAESSMKERYVDEKYETKKVDKMADKCRFCCPEVLGLEPRTSKSNKMMPRRIKAGARPPPYNSKRATPARNLLPASPGIAAGDASGKSTSIPGPDAFLLNGNDSAKIGARIMNIDPIAGEFGLPFLHAHSRALLHKSDVLKNFSIVSCPDIPEDPPPDYSYELALRYFARKAERIYFLLDIASDIDERSCLSLEALAPFKPRLAFVFCISKGCTDLSYIINRHNATVWNLSKIIKTANINHNSEIVDEVFNFSKRPFKSPPRIYSNLFNACGIACPLYGHQFRHAWTDGGELFRFSASRLAREIRLRAVVAVVLALAHNYVLKSQKKAFASISDVGAGNVFTGGNSRINFNSIKFKNTLAARFKGQNTLSNPRSSCRRRGALSQEKARPRKRDERKECDGIQLLDEIEAATAKDPRYQAVAHAIFEALKDLMIYKDFVNPSFVEKSQIRDAKKAVSILTKWIAMDEEHLTKTEQHFGEFDPCGSFGEIKAYFSHIVSPKLQSEYSKTFYLASGGQSMETLPFKSLVHPGLPAPLPRGTSTRIINIAQGKSNEGVCREEFIAFMHMASLKSSGFELPVGKTPPRFTFTWKRKPATVLAKAWFTEKGAWKVPTVEQKEAGQFFIDRAVKNYRHLNIKPLGLKVEVGPNGEQIILGPEDPEANKAAMQAFAAANNRSEVPTDLPSRKILKARKTFPPQAKRHFTSPVNNDGTSWTRLFGEREERTKTRGSNLVTQQRRYNNSLPPGQRLVSCSGMIKCRGKQELSTLTSRSEAQRKLSGAFLPETSGRLLEKELLKRREKKLALLTQDLRRAATKLHRPNTRVVTPRPDFFRGLLKESGRSKPFHEFPRYSPRHRDSLDATIKKLFEEKSLDEISFGRTSKSCQNRSRSDNQQVHHSVSADSLTKSARTKSVSLASQQKSFYASTPSRCRKPPPSGARIFSGMDSPKELVNSQGSCLRDDESNTTRAPTRAAVDELLEQVLRSLDKEDVSWDGRAISPVSDDSKGKIGHKTRLRSPKSLARKAVQRALKRKNKKVAGKFGIDLTRCAKKGILVHSDGFGAAKFENYVHYDAEDENPLTILATAAERKKLLEEVERIFYHPQPIVPNYDEVDLIIGERRQRVRRRATMGTMSRCCKHVRWNERVRVLGELDKMVVMCSDCEHVSTAASDAESSDGRNFEMNGVGPTQTLPPAGCEHAPAAMRTSKALRGDEESSGTKPEILEAAGKLAANEQITIVTEDMRTVQVSLRDLLQLAQKGTCEKTAGASATSSLSASVASTITTSDPTLHPRKLFSELRDFSVERVQVVKNPAISTLVATKKTNALAALDQLIKDVDPYSFECEPMQPSEKEASAQDVRRSSAIWSRQHSPVLQNSLRIELSSESIRAEAGTSDSSEDIAYSNNPALNQLLREVTTDPKIHARDKRVFPGDDTSFSEWSATAGSGGTSASVDAPGGTVGQRRLSIDGTGALPAVGASGGGINRGQRSSGAPEVNTVRSSQLLPTTPSADPLTAPTLVPNSLLDLELESSANKQGSSVPATPVRSPAPIIPPGRRSMLGSERSATSSSAFGGSKSRQSQESSSWLSKIEKPGYFVNDPLPTRETAVKHFDPSGAGSVSSAPTLAAMVHQPGDGFTESGGGVRTTSLIGLPGSKYGAGTPLRLRSTTEDGEEGGVGIVADVTEDPHCDAAVENAEFKFISFGFEPVQPLPAEDDGEQGTAEEIPPPPSPQEEPKPPLMFGFVRLDPNRPRDINNQARSSDEPAGASTEPDVVIAASKPEDPDAPEQRSWMFSTDPTVQEDRRATTYSANSLDDPQPAETSSILGSFMSRFGGSDANAGDEDSPTYR